MAIHTIQKSIEIDASKEIIWKILTEQPYLNEWTGAFMSGSDVRGEFKAGGRILYLDPSGVGVVGEVSEYIPPQSLKVSILAEIKDGEPVFNDPDSEKWLGAYDHYRIEEKGDSSILSLETAFPAEYYDDFMPGWTRMLEKIKELSER